MEAVGWQLGGSAAIGFGEMLVCGEYAGHRWIGRRLGIINDVLASPQILILKRPRKCDRNPDRSGKNQGDASSIRAFPSKTLISRAYLYSIIYLMRIVHWPFAIEPEFFCRTPHKLAFHPIRMSRRTP
jgi:hypothetical protein